MLQPQQRKLDTVWSIFLRSFYNVRLNVLLEQRLMERRL